MSSRLFLTFFSIRLDFMCLVLCLGPSSTWTWALCTVSNMSLYLFLSVQTASSKTTIYRRCFLFSIVYFWFLSQRSSVHRCVVLILHLQFYFIFQHAYLCPSTIQLFLSLFQCRLAWGQGCRFPQKFFNFCLFVCLFVCLFSETGYLSMSDYPGTHFVDQAGLELRNLPASASWVLGLKACATTPGFFLLFNRGWGRLLCTPGWFSASWSSCLRHWYYRHYLHTCMAFS